MRGQPKAILVAAPRSGAGKTTVTLALLAAFRRRGLNVRAAKCGPDYIDAASGADLLIVESAMGLFDGVAGGAKGEGSAAELAARFGLAVLLVLDVSGQAQSAAAVVHG